MANAQISAKNQRAAEAQQGRLEREALRQQRLERVELARFAHVRDEAAAQWAHDAMMFDRQARLEMMRAGHAAPILDTQLDPALHL
jgi:hypothetical protein